MTSTPTRSRYSVNCTAAICFFMGSPRLNLEDPTAPIGFVLAVGESRCGPARRTVQPSQDVHALSDSAAVGATSYWLIVA